MVVTAHFLDEDWKLKSFLIRFIYVLAPHTTEVIAEVLHEVLLDWHIERNLSTITLDNCSVNDNLMKTMIGSDGDDLAKNKAVVEDGMSVMEKGIDNVRDSVAYWSDTPKRHEKFEKMAGQMKGKYEKIIALDWSHSTFVGALMTCLDEKDEKMDEDDSTIIDE
ncbi:zinc finger BED domain-containing protein RICESLEEPER 2-like [Miscanthus floridulus]|uniref:zinc finger BED domain-containing protein RICESLEEPER 2-like n=1 Tax=Miscanthus floridulus TaxID=154761 RepID=UPI0034596E58